MPQYEEIQASDTTDVSTAIDNLQQKQIERKNEEEFAKHQAFVRRLISETRHAIAGESNYHIEDLLLTLHWSVRQHPDLKTVLSPSYEGLSNRVQCAFQDHMELRNRGEEPLRPKEEYKIVSMVAEELEYISAVTDPSQYAPVRYDPVDDRDPSDITPFGRRRFPHDSWMTREDAAVDVPIQACDHQLTMAQPRRGKDSTNVRCAGNLKDEHGYKWVSLLDDGRNENVMIAIPSDDPDIRKSLERMGQTPKAYPCTVYIPKMGDIPHYLPGNFEQFTLGTHQLSPELILRLVGITKTNSNTDRRIKKALDETVRSGGSVSDLCNRLREYAAESEATIEVVELKDDADNPAKATSEVDTITYQMDEDEALKKAAEQIAMLAGEGLIASPNAPTNIDFAEVIRDQNSVAVLNCNFLDDGDKGLHFTIMDIWAQLIYRARDESARLPRVALEVREIKSVCPSKMGDTKYKNEIKPLRQTLFFITTQGGSRGVMLLGSTQKLTDMYKSARSNMAIHIILNLKAEGVKELDDMHHFTQEQRQQIREFDIGQGMVVADGKRKYPVNFAGARCGLGDKDREWIDRYGIAYGARVREDERDDWHPTGDGQYWIDVKHHTVHDMETDGKPGLGTWYVLPQDINGLTAQELIATPHAKLTDGARIPFDESSAMPTVKYRTDVLAERAETNVALPEVVVRAAMVARQEYVVPNDLMLAPTGANDEQRSLTIQRQDSGNDQDLTAVLNDHGVPQVLHGWMGSRTRGETLQRYLEILRTVESEPCGTQPEIAQKTGIPDSTVGHYIKKDEKCGKCVEKEDGEYKLTPIGEKALEIDWGEIASAV